MRLDDLLAASSRVQFRSVQTQNRCIVPWLVLAEAVDDEVRELGACLRVADSDGLILSSPEGFLEFYDPEGRLATVDWLPEEYLRCREHWEGDAELTDGGRGLLAWLEADLRKLRWTFCFTHDQEWSSKPTLQLGPQSLGTPWAYLLVSRAEQPWLRVCLGLKELESAAFEECLLWKSALWVGYGKRVYRIDCTGRRPRKCRCPFTSAASIPWRTACWCARALTCCAWTPEVSCCGRARS